MKSKEELEAIKTEFVNLRKKFSELSFDEFKQVNGGVNEGKECPNGVVESEFPINEHCKGCWAHGDINYGVYHYCAVTGWAVA